MRYVIAALLAAAMSAVVVYLFARPHEFVKPLADVPLYGDPQTEKRLGVAVGAADIGFGLPCAVYRNGPEYQETVQRGQTIVLVCITP